MIDRPEKVWPLRGWTGLVLLALCWPLDWILPGDRTAYLFFPLWLGYILTVDALVQFRTGTSVWGRGRGGFLLLFALSSPVWWIFEFINERTHNWEYLGSNLFTRDQYDLLCTLCFSTVMPAVFETAELARSFRWVEELPRGWRVSPDRRVRLLLLAAGGAMLASVLLWPKYCYPLVWVSLVLLLEPLNSWLGRPHFLQKLQHGDWRMALSLSLGALICGFFWEMWNYYSFPKWIYHTPGAEFAHIFEMPLPGYGGYIPFALELYALKNFLWPRAPRFEFER